MEGVLRFPHILFITFTALNQIYNIAGLTVHCSPSSKFLASLCAGKPDPHLDVRTVLAVMIIEQMRVASATHRKNRGKLLDPYIPIINTTQPQYRVISLGMPPITGYHGQRPTSCWNQGA